jgi:hypothetical protein
MKENKRIFCFGDSFTVGEGANLKLQSEIELMFSQDSSSRRQASEIVSEINKKLSWTKHIGDHFGIWTANYGETGSTNNKIFNNVFTVEAMHNGFTPDDLIIIMWSSSIRDKLSWFPALFSDQGPVGAGWSLKELLHKDSVESFEKRYYQDTLEKKELEYVETKLTPFLKDYFKTYLTSLHSNEYYNLLNLNYIKLLQEYFVTNSIPYIMVDAFECMNSFKAKKDTKWEKLIDTRFYFGEGNTTVWDELDKIGGNVWEDPELSFHPPGQRCHPNAEGYKLVGDMLIDFISRKIWPPKLL